jgi:hypothetical protein
MSVELVLWGLPKGEADRLYEVVLSTQCKTVAEVEKIKSLAKKDGWHGFRIQKLNLDIVPDFIKGIKRMSKRNPSEQDNSKFVKGTVYGVNKLTPYAFRCGYVQEYKVGKLHTDLWMEHGTYDIRTHETGGRGRLAWDTARTSTEAQKIFAKHVRAFYR